MNMFNDYIKAFDEVLKSTQTSYHTSVQHKEEVFNKIVASLNTVKKNKGTVYLVGNGGSSGIISHVSIDLLNACKIKAHPLTDNSILTCMANDYGYENVFSESLKTLITENDILIAVSSSGKSQNILNAALIATAKKATVITFSGFLNTNPLKKLGTYNVWLDSDNYGFVEIGHALLLHYITDSVVNS